MNEVSLSLPPSGGWASLPLAPSIELGLRTITSTVLVKSTTTIFLHDWTRQYMWTGFLYRIQGTSCETNTYCMLVAKDKLTDWLSKLVAVKSANRLLIVCRTILNFLKVSFIFASLNSAMDDSPSKPQSCGMKEKWHSAHFWTSDKIINIQEFREWADTGKQNSISEKKWPWLRHTDSQFARRQSNWRSH